MTIRVHIASDGTVDGQVGTARLVGCKIMSNRGWIGRMLNLWSDYVICDGWLTGPVFRTDRKDAQRSFALPLGLQDGTLKGRFLLLRNDEKPFSLFFNLELKKQPLTPAQGERVRGEIERPSGAPSVPPTKDQTKVGGMMKVGGGTLVFSGSNTYAGAPLAYDDYDKSFWIDWGRHVVALPTPPDLYGPRSIRLPAYALLMQRPVQEQLNLTAEQKKRLHEISAKHESESKKITAEEDQKTTAEREKRKKELDDLSKKMAKARALAEGSPTTAGGYGWSGVGLVWSKEVLEKLERQEQDTRRQIEEVLTPAQLETLKEATFRTFAFGSGIMLQPKVQEKLGLDQKQRDSLRQLDERLQKEKAERLRSVTREKIERMLAVLTPEQWAEIHKSLASWWKSPRLDYSSYPFPRLPCFDGDGAADELGLSAAQRKQVRDVLTKSWKENNRLEGELKKVSLTDEKALKANGEKTLQLLADVRKQIEAVLDAGPVGRGQGDGVAELDCSIFGYSPQEKPQRKERSGRPTTEGLAGDSCRVRRQAPTNLRRTDRQGDHGSHAGPAAVVAGGNRSVRGESFRLDKKSCPVKAAGLGKSPRGTVYPAGETWYNLPVPETEP